MGNARVVQGRTGNRRNDPDDAWGEPEVRRDDPEQMIEHRESEPSSQDIAKKDLQPLGDPEWPGETVRHEKEEVKEQAR